MNVELALKLSKIVHDQCENVPHDIGITLTEAIDSLMPHWISCEDERKPIEEVQIVVGYFKHPRTGDEYYDFLYFSEGKFWEKDTHALTIITHWQCKPQPPKELCSHGKGLTEYCEPCGRIHGGD